MSEHIAEVPRFDDVEQIVRRTCVNPAISATEPATSESAVQQFGRTGIRSAAPPNLPAQ
jgi:hypothetical protein